MYFTEEIERTRYHFYALPEPTPGNVRALKEFLRNVPDRIVGLDCETTSADDDDAGHSAFDPTQRMRLIQFGSLDTAWIIDAGNPFWRKELRTIFKSQGVRYVSHSNYDPLWVRRWFGVDLSARDKCIDCLPMACLLWPGVIAPHDLKTLSTTHLDRGLVDGEEQMTARFRELAPAGKRVGKSLKSWGFTNIPLNDREYLLYAGLDAIYVRRLLDVLAKLMQDEGMAKLSRREQHIARLATGMQWRGMRVDEPYLRKILDDVGGQNSRARTYLEKTLGFKALSPRRGPWLEERGVPVLARTPKGAVKLDQDTVPAMRGAYKARGRENCDPEVLRVLNAMVQLSKTNNIATNLKSILAKRDSEGYVHPRINTMQAHTGRMSIVNPALQTMKKTDKRLRGCFITAPGHTFVGADYDSQEIRLAAGFSKDEALLRIVNEGLNQHKLTAAMIFGDDYDEKQYHQAKVLDFAQQYGAGPAKIALTLGISKGEATKLWKAWRKAYSGLVAWSDVAGQYTHVVNPWGRVIPSKPGKGYANGNFAIQSSGRDVLGDALVRLSERGYADKLWLPIHDEIILQVPDEMAEKARDDLEECMRQEVCGVSLTATATIIGKRWSGE